MMEPLGLNASTNSLSSPASSKVGLPVTTANDSNNPQVSAETVTISLEAQRLFAESESQSLVETTDPTATVTTLGNGSGTLPPDPPTKPLGNGSGTLPPDPLIQSLGNGSGILPPDPPKSTNSEPGI